MTEVQTARLHVPRRRSKPAAKAVAAPSVQPVQPDRDSTIDSKLFPQSTALEHPAVRPLKVYAFDPSAGQYVGNEMTLNVKYETLLPGPMGRRIAVIDYDGENDKFYKPVNLDDASILIRGGVSPTESDPRFHQQMVYAVATDTVQHFDAALGRRVGWYRQERTLHKGKYPHGRLPLDIDPLFLFPHAMISANAAYDRSAKGILFGYFRASEPDPDQKDLRGQPLAGQPVFTCLSHDIIVHETTHAVLDGMRAYFGDRTGPDVAAFHEAFADLAALFRHFAHKEALLDTIQKTGGMLYKYQLKPEFEISAGEQTRIQGQIGTTNPLIELAQEFGKARGTGRALRSALSIGPNPKAIKDVSADPHERGSILVSAVFDAYFTVYLRQTSDVFRLYGRAGGGVNSVELPSAMANLLAAAASRTAEYLFQVCVRAIDYCPPVDITLGDYLRALITADRDLHPTDDVGLRDAVIQAFRVRGITPESTTYFSEDALSWQCPDEKLLEPIEGLMFGDPNGLLPSEADNNGEVLRKYARKHAETLGLRPDRNTIDVASFHPLFHIDPDGSLDVDMVVEICQVTRVPFEPNKPSLGKIPIRSGATLLIRKPRSYRHQHEKNPGSKILYLIEKRLDQTRVERQRAYCIGEGLAEGSDEKRFQLDFNMLHGSTL